MFLYYLVIEGALRKWALPSASNELFLLKDVILGAAVLVLYAIDRRRLRQIGTLTFTPTEGSLWQLWIAITFAWTLLAGFSLTSVIGLRYYLVPLLVLLIQPVLARNIGELERFLDRYLTVCVGVCLLGFVQFSSPSDSLINRYSWSPNSEMDVATFGEVSEYAEAGESARVRITGTFSYISPYAAYLQFLYFAAIGMLLTARSERSRLWFAIATAAILANLLMTGSRGPTFGSLLIGIVFIPSLRKVLSKGFGFVGMFFGLVALIGIGWLAQDVGFAFIARTEGAGDAVDRVMGALFFPVYTIAQSSFGGEGVGYTFLGLGQLTGTGVYEYTFNEVTQDRLAVEVGIVGYIFFLIFKIYFLLATWRFVRRTRNFSVRVWALVSFSYQLSLVWGIPLYNSVAMFFYFFSISLFVWLRRLEQRQQAQIATGGGRNSEYSARAAS
jgi:hypothetical protein